MYVNEEKKEIAYEEISPGKANLFIYQLIAIFFFIPPLIKHEYCLFNNSISNSVSAN